MIRPISASRAGPEVMLLRSSRFSLELARPVLLLGLAFKATDYFDPELIARSTREESKCYAPVMCVADKIFPSLGEYAREYLPRPEREEPAEKPETTEKLQNA